MAMYRATGQAHKPTPPINIAGKNSTIAKLQGGQCLESRSWYFLLIKLVRRRRQGEKARNGGVHLGGPLQVRPRVQFQVSADVYAGLSPQ